MKNLQSIINLLSNKRDEEELDVKDPPEQTMQNIFSSSRSFLEITNRNKRKNKDTGRKDSQTSRKIPPSGEGKSDDSSSDEEPDRRDIWHPKLRRKVTIDESNNLQDQVAERERQVVKWMI